MAIKKQILLPSKVNAEYIKVLETRCCNQSKTIQFSIGIYKDAESKSLSPEYPIEKRSYGPIEFESGSISECYDYLKTLTEFNDAEDI